MWVEPGHWSRLHFPEKLNNSPRVQKVAVQSCRAGSTCLHQAEELDSEMHLLTATRHTSPLPQASEHLLAGLSRVWEKMSSTKLRSNLESLLVLLLWFLVERHSFCYTGKNRSDNTHHCYFYGIKAQVPFAISDFSHIKICSLYISPCQ